MPEFPYIVYGIISWLGSPLSGKTVTIENVTLGGSDTRITDVDGHYIYDDLAELPNGYGTGDEIKVSITEMYDTFYAAAEPEEKEINLNMTSYINTESKRRSVPNMLIFVIPPVPDGTVSNVDREQMSYIYSGITPAGAPIEVTVTLSFAAGISDAGQAEAGGAMSLSSSLAAVDGGGANALSDITVSNTLAFTIGADAVAYSTIAISDILTIINTAQANSSAALSLSDILSIIQFTDFEASLSLSEILTVLESAQADTGGDLAIAYYLALQSSSTSDAAAALSMALNAGISASLQADVNADLTLSKTLAISILAEALASAGIPLSSVQLVVTDARVGVIVVTPSGRTVTIQVELRTVTIEDENRTVIVPYEV